MEIIYYQNHEMKYQERSISFNPAMLEAVRANRKTVTRRRLAKDLVFNDEPDRYKYHGIGGEDFGQPNGALFEDLRPEITPWYQPVPCPFGEVGDTLRIQEDPSIVLEVVQVRVERVQDITEEDAQAEGVAPDGPYGSLGVTHLEPFIRLFQSIYGRDSWERNEWVWVVDFKRLS